MFDRDLREEPAHDGAEGAGELLDDAMDKIAAAVAAAAKAAAKAAISGSAVAPPALGEYPSSERAQIKTQWKSLMRWSHWFR